MWVPEESDTRSGGTKKQRGEQVCRCAELRGAGGRSAGGRIGGKPGEPSPVREAGQGQV